MSTEQLERLIESVRRHPELYDTDHKDYKSVKFKDEIWAEIAQECEFENGTKRIFVKALHLRAKKQWKNLRDSHRECLRRLKTKSGQAARKVKKWRFYDSMAYLDKFMNKRESQSNITEISDDSQITIEENGSSTQNWLKNNKKHKDDEILKLIKSNRIRKDEQARVRNEIRERNKPANQGLYNFFLSMYESVVQFPPHLQRQAKKGVFDVINDLEEKTENEASVTPSLSPDFIHICSTPERLDNEIPATSHIPFREENKRNTSARQGVFEFVPVPNVSTIEDSLPTTSTFEDEASYSYYSYQMDNDLSSFLKFKKKNTLSNYFYM